MPPTSLNELKEPGKKPLALFLDDGGVLNDNRLRGPEWLRLIGEFMPSRLGGTAEQWAEANRVLFPQLWDSLKRRLPEFASHQQFQRTYSISWMEKMCDFVGVQRPSDEDAVTLYGELSIYVGERAVCAIEGSTDAVVSLYRAGYRLFTASGANSWELQAILGRMGIADLFQQLYGPDLIDHVKYGPEFYDKLFAHAGIQADRALVIESDLECCQLGS